MEKKHTLVDNAAEKRYELDLGDDIALAEYVLGRGLIVLTHTEVPPKYEGRGIGKELVQGVLEDIRKKRRSRSSPNARSSRPISAATPNGWIWC